MVEAEYITRLRESFQTDEVLQVISKLEYAFSVVEINLRAIIFLLIFISIVSAVALIKVFR